MRADRIKQALANKAESIELKKSTTKTSDAVGSPILKSDANKTEKVQSGTAGVISKTIVGNTYYVMDSHEDVHVDGCFTKTLKERQDKIFHLHDHEYKITAKVGKPQKVYEQKMAWKDLGVNKAGTTTALLMDTDVRKDYNERIYDAYKQGEIDQHSVGMQYVKIELAADDELEPDAKKLYDETLPKLANREEAEEKGYFFVVKEAKLREISGVLIGSNTVTPTLENKEPLQDTQSKEEPAEPTLKELMYNFNKQ